MAALYGFSKNWKKICQAAEYHKLSQGWAPNNSFCSFWDESAKMARHWHILPFLLWPCETQVVVGSHSYCMHLARVSTSFRLIWLAQKATEFTSKQLYTALGCNFILACLVAAAFSGKTSPNYNKACILALWHETSKWTSALKRVKLLTLKTISRGAWDWVLLYET